jgi:hypothetical protein
MGESPFFSAGPKIARFGQRCATWFHPETIPGVQELRFDAGRDMDRHYSVYFTPGSDQVYMLWYET